MPSHPREHQRRSIRISAYDYSHPGAYFVTVVTHNRACFFGHITDLQMHLSAKGRMAQECWQAIPRHFPNVEMGAYVIMPNHVHGIIILNERADGTSARRGTIYRAPTVEDSVIAIERFQKPVAGSIPTIVRTYKAAVTRLIGREFGGAPPVWQRNYYEHIIRNAADWDRIHLYIESNIANWKEDEENPAKE